MMTKQTGWPLRRSGDPCWIQSFRDQTYSHCEASIECTLHTRHLELN